MRFLLVVKQKRNVDAFLNTVRCLLDRGHTVALAIQDRDERTESRLIESLNHPAFRIVACPAVRTDALADVASLVRRLRDCVHYLKPAMRSATKLRARIVERLRQDLRFDASAEAIAGGLETFPADQVQRLDAAFALAERALPTDPLFDAFLESDRPDVLLVSPLVHFGPAQADLVASARKLAIPVWMLLYSWDNLSTKGTIHEWPDRMFVWNEQQRTEADQLHGYPRERVTVVGAPRFDAFFELRSGMTRREFHESLGLDASRPTLLYVCSSRFVSEGELSFIRKWMAELRASASAALRECNIVVRPHPDIPLLPDTERMSRHRWPALPDVAAKVARPFADPRAIVLQTDFTTPRGLFESIEHSTAVVGLNTTAELEAGIVGRPVCTLVTDHAAVDGQSSTLHFHYLTSQHGGFVSSAATFAEHIDQLDAALTRPPDVGAVRRFVEAFLRPHGIDQPVAPLFAELLERIADSPQPLPEATPLPAADHVAINDVIASRSWSDRPVVSLADPHADVKLYRTPEVERHLVNGVVTASPAAVEWIDDSIGFGDVVYDIGSGLGQYVLLVAKRRGAIVVAFEPAYAAYAELCDNLLLNGCEASVIPIPLALAASEGLAQMKYQPAMPGQVGYTVHDDIRWRVKHRGRNAPYVQPACLTTLDGAISRHGLPRPNHVRLSDGSMAVIAGAAATLSCPSLKTIQVHTNADREGDMKGALAAHRWQVRSRSETTNAVWLVFTPAGGGISPAGS